MTTHVKFNHQIHIREIDKHLEFNHIVAEYCAPLAGASYSAENVTLLSREQISQLPKFNSQQPQLQLQLQPKKENVITSIERWHIKPDGLIYQVLLYLSIFIFI